VGVVYAMITEEECKESGIMRPEEEKKEKSKDFANLDGKKKKTRQQFRSQREKGGMQGKQAYRGG